MNVKQHWTRTETTAVTGLLVSAAGIATLWAAGIEFPVYPPPGIILLGTGAVAFAAMRTRVRWAAALPIVLGAFIQAGFMIEGITSGTGFANLAGDAGLGAQIGQLVQQIGAVTAIVGGVLTLRARLARKTPQAV
ncbi:MAG: hypothetical protein HOQ43_03180 [Glycomyces artemisiae]|uniref:Uncharacterized protein n=1 Tax=Glycomyces artemisiae TaxID=1076443 RepID=A0A850C9I2_9ACTN|nr:hypothetical protein [Glycomyces artemisiae]